MKKRPSIQILAGGFISALLVINCIGAVLTHAESADVASSTPATTVPVIATSTVPESIATTTISVGTTTDAIIASSTDSTGFQSTSTTTLATTTVSSGASTTPAANSSSTPTIQSGTAVALANILNILNANFVNATGATVMLNYVDPVTGDIDLRAASSTLTSGSLCQSSVCSSSEGVTVNLASNGELQNAIVLNATTGGNTINDPGAGLATIGTGNAYAGLNLINLANTNVVDSNYLLVTLNAFQGVNGDIVFPSLTNFLNSLTHTLSTPSSISLTSSSTVSNNVSTSADTGSNAVASSSNSSITTGQASASGNVFNQLNGNVIGGSNVALLFRVQGDWAGQVFGAPPGLTWTQDQNGSVYLFTNASSTPTQVTSGSVTASSTAGIDNSVHVLALTGHNAIQNAASAVITTGNADAAANVINVANTNIVGKNWILAIINIFGDFKGNIDFGRPDLFVGLQASAPAIVTNGSSITYTMSVINNGDTTASNAILTNDFDATHLAVTSSSVPYQTNSSGDLVWELGNIPSGGAVQITYTATVKDAGYDTPIGTRVTASETEPDNNTSDNTDSVTVTTGSASVSGDSGSWSHNAPSTSALGTSNSSSDSLANLVVSRFVGTSTPDKITGLAHEELSVYNDSAATSAPIVLHDVLYDPAGSSLADQAWNLGSVKPHEQVTVSYDARFGTGALSGTYVLASSLVSSSTVRQFPHNGVIVVSGLASVPLTGKVLTHATTTPASSTPAALDIWGTPQAYAAGELAAVGAAPLGGGLLFWSIILGALVLLMGLASGITWYTRRSHP